MKNKRYCIHAHFDLPARENAWLEESEPDPARSPYREERERALQECYGPNSASPLLGADGRILDLVDNYSRISFDFGPELLAFIERSSPRVYARILEADRRSVLEHGGHGNALASPMPPLILPLATPEERRTVVRWGLADFRRRFGREPEGLWLPADGADDEALETLVEEGLSFALLSPGQAAAVRTGTEPWLEVSSETLDTRRPYRWVSRRDPGRTLNVFFYRTDLSLSEVYAKLPRAVAASPDPNVQRDVVLDVARRFANRLLDSFTVNDALELSHLAAPGDIYGLSRLHGDRALACALDILSREAPAARVNYGEYLEFFPPPQEVRLRPCGQDPPARWHRPFREALDGLARELDAALAERTSAYFVDWRRARDAYGDISGGGADLTVPFLEEHAVRHLPPEEARQAVRLCEAARWRLKMLSSWAWSERDVADPCAVSAMGCAARAMDILGLLEPRSETHQRFLAALSKAPSAGTAYPNAAEAYTRLVLPSRVDAERALAHTAVSEHLSRSPATSLDPDDIVPSVYDARISVLCRRSRKRDRSMESLSVFRVRLSRVRTYERCSGTAAVLHLGGSDIRCWVKPGDESDPSAELDEAFSRRPPEAVVAAAGRLFGPRHFGLDALFPAARRDAIASLASHGSSERRCFLRAWHGLIRRSSVDCGALLDESKRLKIPPDTLPGVRSLRRNFCRLAADFAREPEPALAPLLASLEAAMRSGLSVPVWELQELSWRGLKRWIGVSREDERRRLAGLLGLSDALFIFPPKRDEHGD